MGLKMSLARQFGARVVFYFFRPDKSDPSQREDLVKLQALSCHHGRMVPIAETLLGGKAFHPYWLVIQYLCEGSSSTTPPSPPTPSRERRGEEQVIPLIKPAAIYLQC